MSDVKMIPNTQSEAPAMKKEVVGFIFFVNLNNTAMANVSPRT